MSLMLRDDTLLVTVFFDRDRPRDESICLYLEDFAAEAQRLLAGGEAALHLSPGQARALADELSAALRERDREMR